MREYALHQIEALNIAQELCEEPLGSCSFIGFFVNLLYTYWQVERFPSSEKNIV